MKTKSMMARIRLAGESDTAELSTLLAEMQRHYGAVHPPTAAIETQLASLPPGVEILVAEAPDGALQALALFSAVYPGPNLTGGFFLKEIYVRADARGTGLGEALMRALAKLAASRGLKRIDWTVAASNTAALRFYDNLGAKPDPDRVFYRLHGDAFGDLAGEG